MKRATGFPALQRAFHLALMVEGLRPRTITNYVGDVQRFAASTGYRDPRSITSGDITLWLASIQDGRAPKTVREAQLALRRFFRFLAREGEIRRDPTRDMKLMTCKTDPQPTYTEAEVKRLMFACDTKTSAGIRDRALLLTLYDTGVRESELTSMGLPEWERRRVTVSGKTGIRCVPLGMATLQALERYVRRWRIADPPLWRGKKGPLTGSGVLQLVRRRCHQAGVQEKGVHAFRRASAAQMKRLGMNDSDILEVFGWRSVEMLRRYTAAVAQDLAHDAHRRHSPADSIEMRERFLR